jgi:hypothetical protein
MKQHVWQVFGAAALLLTGIGLAQAGVQRREQVYWVGTGAWQLRTFGGEVCLVKSHWFRNDRLPKSESFPWFISTPTIKDAKGRFLASDPDGRSPSVHLVDKKGANARWAFLIGSHLSPGRATDEGRSNSHFKKGPSGFTFRVKQAEGPFAGWYLAAGEPVTKKDTDGKEIKVRPLKLVKDVREATVFTYIETNYYVGHI